MFASFYWYALYIQYYLDDLFQVQSNMGSMQQRTWKDIFDNESEHLIHIETGSTFIPTIMQ